jgi:hypothetical protein
MNFRYSLHATLLSIFKMFSWCKKKKKPGAGNGLKLRDQSGVV